LQRRIKMETPAIIVTKTSIWIHRNDENVLVLRKEKVGFSNDGELN